MLKVLYLPINDLNGCQQGMYNAWNDIGVKLEICDFYRNFLRTSNKQYVNKDFLDKVASFQPDLIHMQLQFTNFIFQQSLVRAKQICPNVKITNWTGDIRNNAMVEFTSISPLIDHSFISSVGQLEMYRNAGCKNVDYWQIGYDPDICYPMWKDKFDYDITFAANYHGNIFPDVNIRSGAIAYLKKNLGARFGHFGSGYGNLTSPLPFNQINEKYNSSICTLSISHYNDVSHYFSDRLLACLASGRPTISWRFPGCEDYFKDGEDLFLAHSFEDISRIIDYCRNNPDIANKVGKSGYEKVLKEHTYRARVEELLKKINLFDRI